MTKEGKDLWRSMYNCYLWTQEKPSVRDKILLLGVKLYLSKKNVEILISSTLGCECTGPLQVQLK